MLTALQLFLHHPDNGKRGAVDKNFFPDGTFTAKEVLRHIPTQESHAARGFHIIRIDKSTAFLGVHVPHELVRGGYAMHQPVSLPLVVTVTLT